MGEPPMLKIDLDFDYSEGLQKALERIARHKGTILSFLPTGPGGGNPLLTLGFPNKDAAMGFIREHDPDEADLHATRLEVVL